MRKKEYRLGSALNFSVFTDTPSDDTLALIEAFGSREKLFSFCAEHLDVIELRSVKSDVSPQVLLNAVEEVISHGLGVTIHGTLGEADTFFAPYSLLFDAGLQSMYNVTVHPAKNPADTERMLRDICAQIEEHNYPVYITLENQRMKTADYYGNCADVTKIVRKINSCHLGTCFDFGHQLYGELLFDADRPEDDFLSLVRHTHIHSFYDGRTHFPLECGEIRLEKNITALLDRGYKGVFLLELSPSRYGKYFNMKDALVRSVHILDTAIKQVLVKKKYADLYENHYLDTLEKIRSKFDVSQCCAALVGHAAYLLKFSDTCIAVDIAPNRFAVSESEKQYLCDWIGGFDGCIVTHAHKDHYDEAFLKMLPDTVTKYIPDFIQNDLPNVIGVTNGAEYTVGDIKIGFFNGAHSHGTVEIPEYGFWVEYRGETYLFPTDVRDYDCKHPAFEDVRALFAHLWLGKGQGLNLDKNEYIEKFCRFVDGFGAKEVYVAHLGEVHRRIEEMWSEVHFEVVKPYRNNAKTFSVGEIIEF